MAAPSNERARLDSWKEIAKYLGRDVRTVVRWEKERSLPVHTVPGFRRRSVFAYVDELDTWLAGTPIVNGQPDDVSTESLEAQAECSPLENVLPEITTAEEAESISEVSPLAFDEADGVSTEEEAAPAANRSQVHGHAEMSSTDAAESPLNRYSRPWLLAFAGIAFVALLTFAYVVSTILKSTAASSAVDKVTVQDNRLVAWDKSGRVAWRYDFPQSSPKYQLASLVRLVGELAEEEFLVRVERQPDNPEAYMLFSSAGRLLWKYAPRDVFQFGKETYSPPWSVRAMHHLTIAGEKHVALALTHHTWWPSMLVLLDEQGHVVRKFVNSGWIVSLDSFEGPKGPLLVAGGASNAHNGAMIAILDANQFAGSSPEEKGSAFDCKNCGPGRPLKYFVFPRSELNVATRSTFNYAFGGQRGERLVIQTREEESPEFEPPASAVYEFSLDLQLLRASFGNRYWDLHRKLEIEGKIMHLKPECPDRDGPRSVLSWDPQSGWKELHPN